MNRSNNRVKFRNMHSQKKINYLWVVTIGIITFFVALILGYSSLVFMNKVSLVGAVLILLVIVFMGIFFDLLGIAVTAATETPFHSMASAKVKGAKESVLIIRNAGAVANFFNDVIGDIAGIISGSASAAIIAKMIIDNGSSATTFNTLLSAVIAAVTVGGKSIGKEVALRHANFIVYKLGSIMSLVKDTFKMKKNK